MERWEEPYRVGSTSLRPVNDGGAWVGTSRFVAGATAGPDGNDVNGSFVQMTGEGGYEGLTMLVFTVVDGIAGPPVNMGFIVPTEVIPPMPEPPTE